MNRKKCKDPQKPNGGTCGAQSKYLWASREIVPLLKVATLTGFETVSFTDRILEFDPR